MSDKKGIAGFFRKKRFRYGGYSILLTVLVIAVVVVLNVLAGAAEDKWALRIDVTANSITDFTDQTYQTLEALDQDVHVHLVFRAESKSTVRTQMEEIAGKYRALNGRITLDFIDPLTEPQRIEQYRSEANNVTLPEGSMIVTNADETRVRQVPANEMYSGQYNQQYEFIPTSFNFESKLTQALMFVTSDSTPRVYFLTGHDELGSGNCSVVTRALANENYEVGDLALGKGTELRPVDVLVIMMPSLDITDAEHDEIRAFLDGGGRMMFIEDASIDMSKTPNFAKLLEYYGARYKQGQVVEDQNATNRWMSSPIYVVPQMDAEHEITQRIEGAQLLLPAPRAVEQTEMPLSGYGYTNLLTTSASSYVKSGESQSDALTRDPADEMGSQTLAMAILRRVDVNDTSKDTRILLLGSPHLLTDTMMTNSHNAYFALSAFDWLTDKQASTYVSAKRLADTMLSIPNQQTFLILAGIVVIALPLVIVVAGIWVFMKRRRL